MNPDFKPLGQLCSSTTYITQNCQKFEWTALLRSKKKPNNEPHANTEDTKYISESTRSSLKLYQLTYKLPKVLFERTTVSMLHVVYVADPTYPGL